MSPASSAPRRVVGLLVPVIAVALAASGCAPGSAGPRPGAGTRPDGAAPAASSSAPATEPTAAAAALAGAVDGVLQRQAGALADDDRGAFLADWAPGPGAQRRATDLYDALTALDATLDGPRVVPGTARATGATATVDVRVDWRLGARSRAASESALTYRLVVQQGRSLISSMGATAHGRLPVWLLPDVVVRRTPRTMVAAGTVATAAQVRRLLTFAVTAVQRVLPGWRGTLVAYAPPTTADFDALVAARPHEYDGIAAVTTTADGSDSPTAPLVIVLNPLVFDRLGPIGAHVVISHEATHVATHAPTAVMPRWLTEGFADYVGIGASRVATAVAARAAVQQVRRLGAPSGLPDDAAFAASGSSLEATYEQAWLATAIIAGRYGRQALVDFYRWVQAHPTTPDAAFRAVLHISPSAFTALWRGRLEELAGAG